MPAYNTPTGTPPPGYATPTTPAGTQPVTPTLGGPNTTPGAGYSPTAPNGQQNAGAIATPVNGNSGTNGAVAQGEYGGNSGSYAIPAPAFGQMPQVSSDPLSNGSLTSTGANAYAGQLGTLANSFLNQQAQNPANAQFGQALNADASQQAAAAQAQQANLNTLYGQATGSIANPADAVMQQGLAQQQAQQQALARSAGIGGAGALAARNAQMNNAVAGVNTANQTAQANAAFQAQAAQQYGTAAGAYGQQAQQQQQEQQQYGTNYGQLQGTQNVQNAQNQLAAQQQGMNVVQGQLTADTNMYTAEQQENTNQQMANNAAAAQMTNAAIAGGTTAGEATLKLISDARLKTDIRRDTLADQFMDHLHPYSYRYQDPNDEPADGAPTGGHYLGVMAQDVERAPGVGPQIVKNTPRGKALSTPATVSALAAGVGRLHERLKALEAERAGKENADAG